MSIVLADVKSVQKMSRKEVIIGSRGSKLALTQAEGVCRLLTAKAGEDFNFSLKIIKTSGDLNLLQPLATMQSKGVFTKELEEALIAQEIDLAVHSLKDMPGILPNGLTLADSPQREDVRDALLLPQRKITSLEELGKNLTLGSGSPRRIAFFTKLAKNISFQQIRGNVDTRIAKMEKGEIDGLVLACAGLRRLSLAGKISLALDPTIFIPQLGQGALALEIREKDQQIKEVISLIGDKPTISQIKAERSFLKTVDMGCQAPLGCLATIAGQKIILRARVCQLESDLDATIEETADLGHELEIGRSLGSKLLKILNK